MGWNSEQTLVEKDKNAVQACETKLRLDYIKHAQKCAAE